MLFIDTHCHLNFSVFNSDREVVIAQAQQHGVSHFMIPATHAETWQSVENICHTSPACYPTYGLHPMFLPKHKAEHLVQLKLRLQHQNKNIYAVGECGLDFFVPDLDQNQQLFFFIEQLKLAAEFDKPLIIHARRSLDIVLKHIRQFEGLCGVVHSFSGSLQQAEQLWEQGFYLGVGGTVTYSRAKRLQAVLTQMPLESLVLETDSPDQPDSAWRGKRNQPERLPIIAQKLADLRQDSLVNIANITTSNAKQLFNLP